MKIIRKSRREAFGAVIFSEHPGFMAFVNDRFADFMRIPRADNLPSHCLMAPLDVHLSLTTRCNLYCRGCYALDSSTPPHDLDPDLAKAIIDNLAQLNVFTIALGGGEPFLYPHLFDLANYIRCQDMVPTITTNGVLISDELAARCRVFGNMHISLHHMGEMTGLQQAIARLHTHGIYPGLNLLLSVETISHLDTIFAWCARIKINKVLLLRFKLTNWNQPCAAMQISTEQERTLFPQLKALARKYELTPMIDCSLFPALAVHKLPEKHLRFQDVNGCQGGNMYMAVDVYGNYKPCSFWPEIFGTAQSLTQDEWINSPALNTFRKARPVPGCESCAYLQLCNGGCRLQQAQLCHLFP